MRKIVVQLAVSLDSFIEDANGNYDWCFTDDDYGMKDFFYPYRYHPDGEKNLRTYCKHRE
jgi:hypothetical protein